MRIIAGRFRRKKLVAAPGKTTRPLTDRVKERLFERLGEFEGQRVLDMFAGTGTIGLEALSRGARHAVFIERDHKAFDLLQRNVDSVRMTEETLCWRTDALRCSFRPRGRSELIPYDRVFCDPPYAIAHQIRPGTLLFRAIERLARPDVSAVGVELILRVPVHQEIEIPWVWHSTTLMRVGGMAIYLLRRAEEWQGRDAEEEMAPLVLEEE